MVHLYQYRCSSLRTIDGDTAILDIDLGLHVHIQRTARLLGINAPEIKGATREAGERSKRRLAELIDSAGDELCCRTELDHSDRWGRILVVLYPHRAAVTSFNDILINERLAVPYAG